MYHQQKKLIPILKHPEFYASNVLVRGILFTYVYVAIVHMGLCTSDVGWGRGFFIVHETVRRQ